MTDAFSKSTKIFRSFDHDPENHSTKLMKNKRSSGCASQVSLNQVARATMSRPYNFSPVLLNDARYEDAGKNCRNPSREAILEVRAFNNLNQDAIHCLVSIGCGAHQRGMTIWHRAPNSGKNAKRNHQEYKAVHDCDWVHEVTIIAMQTLGKAYHRLDLVDHEFYQFGMPLSLDPSSRLWEKLEKERSKRISSGEMHSKLLETAQRLVERRHAKLATEQNIPQE